MDSNPYMEQSEAAPRGSAAVAEVSARFAPYQGPGRQPVGRGVGVGPAAFGGRGGSRGSGFPTAAGTYAGPLKGLTHAEMAALTPDQYAERQQAQTEWEQHRAKRGGGQEAAVRSKGAASAGLDLVKVSLHVVLERVEAPPPLPEEEEEEPNSSPPSMWERTPVAAIFGALPGKTLVSSVMALYIKHAAEVASTMGPAGTFHAISQEDCALVYEKRDGSRAAGLESLFSSELRTASGLAKLQDCKKPDVTLWLMRASNQRATFRHMKQTWQIGNTPAGQRTRAPLLVPPAVRNLAFTASSSKDDGHRDAPGPPRRQRQPSAWDAYLKGYRYNGSGPDPDERAVSGITGEGREAARTEFESLMETLGAGVQRAGEVAFLETLRQRGALDAIMASRRPSSRRSGRGSGDGGSRTGTGGHGRGSSSVRSAVPGGRGGSNASGTSRSAFQAGSFVISSDDDDHEEEEDDKEEDKEEEQAPVAGVSTADADEAEEEEHRQVDLMVRTLKSMASSRIPTAFPGSDDDLSAPQSWRHLRPVERMRVKTLNGCRIMVKVGNRWLAGFVLKHAPGSLREPLRSNDYSVKLFTARATPAGVSFTLDPSARTLTLSRVQQKACSDEGSWVLLCDTHKPTPPLPQIGRGLEVLYREALDGGLQMIDDASQWTFSSVDDLRGLLMQPQDDSQLAEATARLDFQRLCVYTSKAGWMTFHVVDITNGHHYANIHNWAGENTDELLNSAEGIVLTVRCMTPDSWAAHLLGSETLCLRLHLDKYLKSDGTSPPTHWDWCFLRRHQQPSTASVEGNGGTSAAVEGNGGTSAAVEGNGQPDASVRENLLEPSLQPGWLRNRLSQEQAPMASLAAMPPPPSPSGAEWNSRCQFGTRNCTLRSVFHRYGECREGPSSAERKRGAAVRYSDSNFDGAGFEMPPSQKQKQ